MFATYTSQDEIIRRGQYIMENGKSSSHLVERYTQLHEGVSADSVRAADVYIDSFDSLAEAEWAMRQILRGLNPEKNRDVSTDGNIMVFAREAGATDRYDLMSYNELREELISRLSRLNMSYKGCLLYTSRCV